MADDEFLWEFLVESYENLDNIDARLVALEANQDPDSVAAIFRSMHTIKGTSGFFGFSLVERVGHVAENLLGRIRDGELSLTSERASALLAWTDALRALFAGIEAGGVEPPYDITELVARLEALTRGETYEAEAPVLEAAVVAEITEVTEVTEVAEVAEVAEAVGLDHDDDEDRDEFVLTQVAAPAAMASVSTTSTSTSTPTPSPTPPPAAAATPATPAPTSPT